MLIQYVGQWSRGADAFEINKVTFTKDGPSEVTDDAAIRWFKDHPDYAEVDPVEEPAPKPKRSRKK